MPSRLARYLLRQTTGMYLLGVAAFCLLISIDFLAVWAEYLIEQNAGPQTVGRLMLYRLPWFLHLSLPVATVWAVLITTGRLARDSELKAAYAMGVHPSRLLVPLLLFGLVVSGLSLLNNGYLEPEGESRYNALVDSFFYTRPPNAVQSNAAFAIEDSGVFYASRIRAQRESNERADLSGVLVIQPDGTVLSAATGLWDSAARTWRLVNAERRRPGEEPTPAGRVTLPFDLESDAQQTLSRRETLSLPDLSAQISAVRAAGGNARDLVFALHRRVADAFSAFVFVLFAGALGLGLRGRAAGFAWTIVLLVIFWATWTLAGNLFDSGYLSAVSAAWLTPALVGVLGLLVAVRRTSA